MSPADKSSYPDRDSAYKATRLAPTPQDRARVVEMSARLEVASRGFIVATIIAVVGAFITGGPWALLPLAVSVVVTLFSGPRFVGNVRPEYVDTTIGSVTVVSIAAGAGLTGGVASPLAFMLPLGAVMGAARNTPLVNAVVNTIALAVFVATALLSQSQHTGSELVRLLALVVSVIAIMIISRALARAETQARRASVLDPLTGLLNRGALDDRFEELRQQAVLTDASICLILFDLDRFKAINDEHGHSTGDTVLRDVAYRVRKSVRRFELVYRVGGEEFLLVLPALDESGGMETAEMIRSAIDSTPIAGLHITASFGVSAADGADIDLAELYGRADEALYLAKEQGRNTARAAGQELQRTPTGAGL